MKNGFNLEQYIMHHVLDSREWHLPFLPVIHLPPYLTLHGVMMLLAGLILLFLALVVHNKKERVPRGFTNLMEVFVIFIRDQIAVSCLGEKDGRRMTPLFCTFFFFILIMNLLGLVPLFATATANVNVTGSLASITLVFMIFGAVLRNGPIGFMKTFVPHGIPWPVLIILTPIEFLGLFIKAGALTIRLFANMLAGHIIILALLGLIVVVGWAMIPSIFLALFISLIEVFVAFLQAYIFTLLSAMFIGQTYHPAH